LSFLDNLGAIASGIGDFTGLSDAAHDFAGAFTNENNNIITDIGQAIRGAGRIPTAIIPTAWHTVGWIGREAQQASHYATGGLALLNATGPIGRSTWQKPGESGGQYWDRVFDATVSNDGNDANRPGAVSLGQVLTGFASQDNTLAHTAGVLSGGGGFLGGSVGGLALGGLTTSNLQHNIDPFAPSANDNNFHQGQWWNPASYSAEQFMSGSLDASSGSILDPTNILGPVGKVARVASTGAKIVSDAEKAGTLGNRIKNAGWTMSDSSVNTHLNDAVKSLGEGKGGGSWGKNIDWLVNSDAATIAAHPKINNMTTNVPLFSYIMGMQKSADGVKDSYKLLMGWGTDAEKQDMIGKLTADAVANGTSGQEANYVLSKIVNGSTEQVIAARTGLDHIKDPVMVAQHKAAMDAATLPDSGVFANQYAQALADAAGSNIPVITKTFGSSSFLAGRQLGRASSRADNAYTVYQQTTSMHPLLAIRNVGKLGQDFFTKERTSGYVHFDDNDSYKEIGAVINDINNTTKGAFASTSEAHDWMNRYLAATTNGDRMNVYNALEKRGMDLTVQSTGKGRLTPKQLGDLQANLRKRTSDMLDQHHQNGSLSIVDDAGNTTVTTIPTLIRQGPGVMPTMDFRGFSKALDHFDENGLKGALHAVADGTLQGVDMLNNVFKSAVLMRLGYTVRNLTEAGLSMAVEGYAVKALMTAGHESAASWVINRNIGAQRAIDRVAVNRGFRVDTKVAEDDMAVAAAAHRNALSTGELINDSLGTLNWRLSKDDINTLRNPSLDPERSAELTQNLKDFAAIRGEQTRGITYHMSTDGKLKSLNGDWVDTHAREGVALNASEDAWTRVSDPKRLWQVAAEQSRAGKRVQIRTNELGWQELSPKRVAREAEKQAKRNKKGTPAKGRGEIIRYNPLGQKRPAVVPISSYGNELDLTNKLNFPDELKPFAKDLSTPEASSAIAQYARENGIGRAMLPDAKWGTTTRVFTQFADHRGGGGAAAFSQHEFKSILKDDLAHIYEPTTTRDLASGSGDAGRYAYSGSGISPVTMADVHDTPTVLRASRKDNRLARNEVNSAQNHTKAVIATGDDTAKAIAQRELLMGRRIPIVPGWDKNSLSTAISDGFLDTIRDHADNLAAAGSRLDTTLAQLAEVRARQAPLNVRRHNASGTRTVGVNGTTYEDARGGPGGEIFGNRVSNLPSYNHLYNSPSEVLTGGIGSMAPATVNPGDVNYFKAWSNTLNHYFRDPTSGQTDSVVEKFLGGANADDVTEWATTTAAGRRWADELAIPQDKVGEAVHGLESSVHMYLPPGIQDAWRAGELTDAKLAELFKGRTDLPQILGFLIPGSPEYARGPGLIAHIGRKANEKVFKYLGSLPEDTFARNPLFTTHYRMLMDEHLPRQEARLGRPLNTDEVNAMATQAREQARMKVNNTLFTINRQTGAAQNVRLISPFYAAWENSMKRWSKFAVHDTERIARAGSMAARVMNDSTFLSMTTGEKVDPFTHPQDDLAMVSPLSFDGVSIPIPVRSFDVIFQGESGPGVGPFVTAPLGEITKHNPSLEQLTSWAFPAGLPKDIPSNFLPSAVKDFQSINEDNVQFANTVTRITQNEYMRFQLGQRPDAPKRDEVIDKAQKFFMLKALVHVTAPVTVRLQNTASYYAGELRNLQKMYGDSNTSHIGEQKFLDLHPEAWVILPSVSRNASGLYPTAKSVDQVQRYSNLAAEANAVDPKLAGWVGNFGQDFGSEPYSNAAYSWEQNNSPASGAATYRGANDPETFIRDAKVNAGWTLYTKVMDVVETKLAQQGIDQASDQGQKIMSKIRSKFADSQRLDPNDPTGKGTNPWYEEYKSFDKARYQKRADFFQNQVLQDPQFMADHKDDRTVQAMAVFLKTRDEVQSLLYDQKANGGAASLSAKVNAGIREQYLQVVNGLKTDNIGFADWYNRFFTSDSVVL
jgi:hypothetical protein